MNISQKIVAVLNRYILIALIALIIGVAATFYTISKPIDFKLGITVVTDEANAPWQFYCHANNHYRGEFSSEGYYSSVYEIEPNTYRIKIPIVCGNDATHMRFDPLPGAGEVTITNIRVHTHDWQTLSLNKAYQFMKPINSISHVELTDDGIYIKSIGHDPHLEFANNLQDYIATTWQQFLAFTIKFSVFAFVLLWLLQGLLVFVLKRADDLLKLGQAINQQLANFLNRRVNVMSRGFLSLHRYSWFIVLMVGLYFVISATVFSNHLSIKGRWLYGLVWSSIALHAVLFFGIYALMLRLLGHANWARYVLGYAVIIFAAYIFADVGLYTLNGMHADHGLGMLFYGGYGEFFKNLRFTGLPKKELAFYVVLLLLLLIGLSALIYWLEKKVTRFRFSLTGVSTIGLIVIAIVGIYGSQKLANNQLTGKQVADYNNHYIFGLSFYNHNPFLVSFPVELKPFKRRDILVGDVPVKNKTLQNKNIYLFIFESLREDMVNKDVMPYLTDFKSQSLHFKKGVASGNATHYGWYAIINGLQPFYWDRYRNITDKKGSLPLQIFKKLGYQVNVYTAKDLSYLGSDKIMFGESLQQVDYISDHPKLSPPEHDVRVTKQLIKDIQDKHSNGLHLNLIFLDSSHYPYRWLDEGIKAIKPIDGDALNGPDVSKAKRLIKKDPRLVVNRYKNSMMFMDYLFNQTVQSIADSPEQNNAAIAVVGDHGQQFMEHGYMLHGFTLFAEDVDVPVYFKFPDHPAAIKPGVVAQVDIIPTLLDWIGVDIAYYQERDELAGHSALAKNPHGYELTTVAGEQNTPYSYALVSPQWKVLFKSEQKRPTDSKFIHVVRVLDKNDQDYTPEDASQLAYKRFIEKQFPGFLKDTDIFK